MHRCDVAVVGCGVAGACVARELSRYKLDVVVLEAGLDIAEGATRANSGIVHAGFDPKPKTRMAYYNVMGSGMYEQWARELKFPYQRNGSLVIAFTDEDMQSVHTLYERGCINGVKGLRIINAQELHELEPSVSPEAIGALYAPTGAICDPYKVAFGAAENAVQNGVKCYFDTRVIKVEPVFSPEKIPGYEITNQRNERLWARCVVNATGVHADELHAMVSHDAFIITPRKGEYCLLDENDPGHFTHTVFQAPTPLGKGVLVTPTVHGNLLVGPNACDQEDKESVATTSSGLQEIVEKARRTYPQLSLRRLIANFAGLRAHGDQHDFILGEPSDAPGFFNIAAFASPGLTSAPAVAHEMARDIAAFLKAEPKASFDPYVHVHESCAYDDIQKTRNAIKENAAAGHMVCRCKKVTEADIVAALHTHISVLCLDAIKWRTNAMMGACHGGFCEPEIAKIVARELGVAPDELPKRFMAGTLMARAPKDYVANVQSEKRTTSAVPLSRYDVAVVGGGAAGIAAATRAARMGARVVLIDRESAQGGILKQCIHNGFGLHRFSCELTGPEYAARELEALQALDIDAVNNATVLSVTSKCPHRLNLISPAGAQHILATSVVLATGSRERGAGALNMAGTRPAGVYSAGSAQNFMNLQGCLPGNEVVILGSGDIGLIMARRLTCAGAHVVGVYEINEQPSGLRRNIVQCLDDYGIALHTSHTVVELVGASRLEAVIVAQVDPHTHAVIEETKKRIACDTLLLSVGLIPENAIAEQAGVQLSSITGGPIVNERYETTVPGIFSCGNALHIHDLVDFVSQEGEVAGCAAAQRSLRMEQDMPTQDILIHPGEGVRYVVPQKLNFVTDADTKTVTLRLRTSRAYKASKLIVEAINADGQRVEVAHKNMMVAVPAEMQSISVKTAPCYGACEMSVRVVER